LFWWELRAKSGQKNGCRGQILGKTKWFMTTQTQLILFRRYSITTLHHRIYSFRHQLPSSAAVRCWFQRPPPSATVHCHLLLFLAVRHRPPSATICHHHQIILNPVESQETETCLCFLYSRVCLWSIVVNSAKKLSRQNKAGKTARGGQSGQICPRAK
jgi:hypothetical protein